MLHGSSSIEYDETADNIQRMAVQWGFLKDKLFPILLILFCISSKCPCSLFFLLDVIQRETEDLLIRSFQFDSETKVLTNWTKFPVYYVTGQAIIRPAGTESV